MKEQPISTKSTDYATIKLTCRPNLLNSRPQRIGFYSKLEILACIQWLTDFKLGAQVSKIHDRISITHALVFIIFSGCATLESWGKLRHDRARLAASLQGVQAGQQRQLVDRTGAFRGRLRGGPSEG